MAINSDITDLDDDLDDEDTVQAADETDEIIRRALAQFDADPGDDQVFSGDMEEAEVTAVPMEQGLELLDSATNKRGAGRKAEDHGEGDDAKPAAAGDEAAADGAADDAAAKPEVQLDEIDTLLSGLDDDRRTQVRQRITQADDVMSIFHGRDEELRLHGTTPRQVIARLVQLNEYATQKPEEYLAWAATQINPDKAEDILISAAEKLGLKLVREEEDPFEDEVVKNLRLENRQLKARDRKLGFGPDEGAPAQQATAAQQSAVNPVLDTLQSFISEKAADGTPARPHWDRLKGDVVSRAHAHRQATGQYVTPADLDRFYKEAEADARKAFGAAPTVPAAPAAQAQPAVSGVTPTKAASPDRVARAKAASTSIDGTGQGAGRRPALAADAKLEDVIRHAAGLDD